MALTNLYGVNYKAQYVTLPPTTIHQGEAYGKERVMYEKFTLDADAADGDTVVMGRLPAGAKVIGARVFGPDLGGTGTLELGNSVSVDGSATDAADTDSLIDAADSSGQAFDVVDSASSQRGPAIGLVRFTTPVNVTLRFVGVTASATGLIVYMIVRYIVD